VAGTTITFVGSIALDNFRGLGIPMMESAWTVMVEEGLIQTFDFSFTPEALAALTVASRKISCPQGADDNNLATAPFSPPSPSAG